MMGFLGRQWDWFCDWYRSLWDRPYSIEMVEELPDNVVPKILYVAGEDDHLWFATMVCPCGCGETLQLGLLKDTRPRWTLEIDARGRPTLSPSVWRKVGCRSHFFMRGGLIEWCESTPSKKRKQL